MIELGDKIRFKPAANHDKSAGFGEILGVEVTGTVVSIHAEHRWYRVAYPTPQGELHECFPLPQDPGPAIPEKRYYGPRL